MNETEKLEVLQGVANDVVNRGDEIVKWPPDLTKAIKALELVLVAIGARQESVNSVICKGTEVAMASTGSKPPPEQS